MLNTWPDLLTYSFFAPLLLRVAAGLSTVYFGYLTYRAWASRGQWLATLWMLGGLFLIIGLWTQIAATVLLVLLILKFLGWGSDVKWTRSYDLLLLATLLSLLLTGAGAVAFDLPL